MAAIAQPLEVPAAAATPSDTKTPTTQITPISLDDNDDAAPLPPVVGPAPDAVFPHMSIGGNFPIKGKTAPVHETMTLAALIHSTFALPPDNTAFANTAPAREFMRGAVWNDDPRSHTFADTSDPLARSTAGAARFAADFAAGQLKGGFLGGLLGASTPGPSWNLTARSHLGDMQFLHAMAARAGEPAATTVEHALAWIEGMYAIATGGVDPGAKIETVPGVGRWFVGASEPGAADSVAALFKGTTPSFAGCDVAFRAVGSAMHVVQDAFAAGHIGRAGGGVGPITRFHTYKGQDEKAHAHLDHEKVSMEDVSPRDLASFDGLPDVRAGIDACVKFADFWHARAPWGEVREWLVREVFALAPDVLPADAGLR